MRLTGSIGHCIWLAALLAAAACAPGATAKKADAGASGAGGTTGLDPGSNVTPPLTHSDAAAGTGGALDVPPPFTNGNPGAAGTGLTPPRVDGGRADSAPPPQAGTSGGAGAAAGGPGGSGGAAGKPGGSAGAAGGSSGAAGAAAGSSGAAGAAAGSSGAAGTAGGSTGAAGASTPDAGKPTVDASAPPETGPPVDGGPLVERIGFGSCNDLTRPQTFWTPIVAQKPQVFLFLGDNAYLDYGDTYEKLGAVPGFKSLMAIARPLAIWDDHDYGTNDGGGGFTGKESYKKKFVDFWGPLGAVPVNSPRRTRPGNYDATILGPVGRQVQVIQLDNRWFKGAAPSGTVLGDAQWQWLADELRRPANLRIIMSGFQALGSSTSSEGWGEYPAEQQHLLNVIKESQAKGVVIVSGDKHYAEISRRDAPLDYPLYDFTSSSLSASNSYAPEANQFRDTPTAASQNHNFGLMTIDWAAPGRPLTVQIYDAGTGAVLMSKSLSLAALGSP